MFLTANFDGDVHEAMIYVNKLECASTLFQVVSLPSGCILIFKITYREDQARARVELGLKPG